MNRYYFLLTVLFLPFLSPAQDLYKEMESMIHPFSGNFQWSKKITSISSSQSDKEIPISLKYNSNIKTNSPSGWVGLGFQLNTGEIVRELNGAPDERSAFYIKDRKLLSSTEISDPDHLEDTYLHGPLLFAGLGGPNSNHSHDVIFTSLNGMNVSFPVPAFDRFHVSSPLYNGTFQATKSSSGQQMEVFTKSWEQGGETMESFNFSDPEVAPKNYKNFHWDNDPLNNTSIIYFTKNEVLSTSLKTTNWFYPYIDENGSIFDYTNSNLDGDDIVAFTIVLKDGTKLCYSIPVIQNISKTYSLKVNDNGNIKFTDTIDYHEVSSYVKSWKLSAIVGPNYVDDGDSELDKQDEGFWVRYCYSKWGDVTENRIPFHGFNSSSAPRSNNPGSGKESFQYKSSVTIEESEKYYMDKIFTDKETLIFYKSLKLDDYRIDWSSGMYEFIPSLKLSKIARYSESDFQVAKDNIVIEGASDFSNINSSLLASRDRTYLISDYQASPNSEKLLNQYDLNYSYEVARGYYCHISNSSALPNSSPNYSPPSTYNDRLFEPQGTYSTNGKLTLIQLTAMDYNSYNSYGGSFTFSYDPANNFLYNNNYTDNFGYYNNRSVGHLSNKFVPRNHVNNNIPWTVESITYPTGNILEVDYEKNYYSKVLTGNTGESDNIVIPIKDIEVLHILELNSDGKAIGEATLRLTLYDNNDKDMLTQYANREIGFRGHYYTCNEQITDAQGTTILKNKIRAYGNMEYNANSNLKSNATMSINTFNVSGAPNAIEVTVDYRQYDDRLSCATLGMATLLKRPFLEVFDQQQVGSGARVNEMRLYESSSVNEHFKVIPNYQVGIIGSVISPWKAVFDDLSMSAPNNSTNSLPTTNGYEKVTINKYDLLGDIKESTVYHYDHEQRYFRGKVENNSGPPCECYIPRQLTYIPFHKLWEYMNDDNPPIELPDLLACNVQSYINEELLPGSGIDPSDYQGIYDALEDSPITVDGSSYPQKNRSGQGPNLYCYQGMVECDGVQLHDTHQDCQGDPDPQFKFFDYYTQSQFNQPVFVGTIVNNSQLFGRPTLVEHRDKYGQVTMSTEYKYGLLAKKMESFKLGVTRESDVPQLWRGTYKLKYRFNHYGVDEKRISSTGVEALAKTTTDGGLPINKTTGSPLVGITDETTTYLFEEEPLFKKISRIEYVNSDNKLIDANTIPNYSNLNVLNANGKSSSKFGITTHDGWIKYEKDELIFTTSNDNIYMYNSDEIDQLDLNSEGVQSIVENDVSSTNKSYLFGGVGKKINGNNYEEQSISLFSNNERPLEMYNDVTDTYTSTLYGSNGRRVLAKIANCRYLSFTSCGFEYDEGNNYFEGEVLGSSNQSEILTPHTGHYVAEVYGTGDVKYISDQFDKSKSHLEEGRHYTAMVWVNNQVYSGDPYLEVDLSGSLDGGVSNFDLLRRAYLSDNDAVSVGDWTLLRIDFEIPESYTPAALPDEAMEPVGDEGESGEGGQSGSVDIGLNRLVITLNSPSGNSYFDDFRFQPIEADMQMSVYDRDRLFVSHKVGSNNFFTKYQHDDAGRITEVWLETPNGVKLIEQNIYND